MPNSTSHQISLLLDRWNHGDNLALEQLMPLVYNELRRMARGALRRQGAGHTLQTTELLHETYLKLAGKEEHGWKNRSHFFGVAAMAMRHILVDYARRHGASKRGDGVRCVSIDEAKDVAASNEIPILALDHALDRLE